MTATHVGKIGRLPKSVRHLLGRRIEDGEPGTEIVKWLNGLPGVLDVLQEQFDGHPITEQMTTGPSGLPSNASVALGNRSAKRKQKNGARKRPTKSA
jgi:hypothetical protein